MTVVGVEIETMVGLSHLSGKAARDMAAVLNDASQSIPLYRLSRLLDFLKSLQAERLLHQAAKRRPLLENFAELLLRIERAVARICYIYYEQPFPEKRPKYQLPEEMIRILAKTGKAERSEQTKTILWDLLYLQGEELVRFVSPEDLIFAFWLKDPLTRGKLIMFMFRHFNPEGIVEALCREASARRRNIPSHALAQIVGLARAGAEFRHINCLLSNFISEKSLNENEAQKVWSDYLKTRNRFELIAVFDSKDKDIGWIEDLLKNRGQLSFDFKPAKDAPPMGDALASRVRAIRALAKREVVHSVQTNKTNTGNIWLASGVQ